jgi:hypothetical protein
VIGGTSRVAAVSVGATPVVLALEVGGSEAGVGLLADIAQQEAPAGASWMLTGDAGALIIGQWGTHFFAAGIWSKHGERAVACNARSMIASVNATSLERRVMIYLSGILLGRLDYYL